MFIKSISVISAVLCLASSSPIKAGVNNPLYNHFGFSTENLPVKTFPQFTPILNQDFQRAFRANYDSFSKKYNEIVRNMNENKKHNGIDLESMEKFNEAALERMKKQNEASLEWVKKLNEDSLKSMGKYIESSKKYIKLSKAEGRNLKNGNNPAIIKPVSGKHPKIKNDNNQSYSVSVYNDGKNIRKIEIVNGIIKETITKV
ncbi:hypothetical protein AYI70_g3041 [Smittium culicis]|uniref:Uncharacterized protein n=1 Tax=Smittium culicis TaxID=133412 RepID=A0A1R1Y5Q4_9FUNG|nr:hypothetical protein AYI70_g3041 [Smittium culicis]